MLNTKNYSKELDKELFKNPTKEFRGAPFWAWNCKMTEEDIDSVLETLKEMGMGGAHFHSRSGMDIPYLSDEFMDKVCYATEKSKQLDMLAWLYDEDRWPSGSAGGLVTKDPTMRRRFLVFSPYEKEDAEFRVYLERYEIRLEQGLLVHYRRLGKEEVPSEGTKVWYLYREYKSNEPWFNNQSYLDTLNPKAVRRFLDITHEAFYHKLGHEFSKNIPAIFTDEPQFCFKETLGYAEEEKELVLPYTDDFPETYLDTYGKDFFDTFPECVWDLPEGQHSIHRYHYHDHICQRFTEAFSVQVGNWCEEHNIALSGHLMLEGYLGQQTSSLGESMRSYRGFGIPGIDVLCDDRELSAAKQAQSVVHQYGKEAMLAELYGVTNWDFDFRGHKLSGDWLAALGTTVRVHHLTWTSMAGEAKRDYPASIGSQSPWYKEYRLIEDYFARLSTVLRRGKPCVKVGVVHPIESYWLLWGPREQSDIRREEMEQRFGMIVEWLLFGLVDFNFISEELWKELTPQTVLDGNEEFHVGQMNYEVILVPDCITIRSSTLERLKAFRKSGGRVIFMGDIPSYVDAMPSDACKKFAEECEWISFAKDRLLKNLENERIVDVHDAKGCRTDNILSQFRNDQQNDWLFLSHCKKMPNPDVPVKEELTIKIKGSYQPIQYDAMDGTTREVACEYKAGNTIIHTIGYEHDSYLYRLNPVEVDDAKDDFVKEEVKATSWRNISIPDRVEFIQEEPNVLVLDMAEAKFDNGEWREREEILRIDTQFRKILGYQERMEAFPQPWVMEKPKKPEHKLTLRFRIQSEIELQEVYLALENIKDTVLWFNGEKVLIEDAGYFVDRAIRKVRLTDIKIGENILLAEMPFYSRFNVEAMYLLGEFGVNVSGRTAVLTEPIKSLTFSDICYQRLPFYGGNLRYRIPVHMEKEGALKIAATYFRCPLIGVELDGERVGNIAFSPYELELANVDAGEHVIELIAYGNRVNTFGALHNCDNAFWWWGPHAWRTYEAAWSYEYHLKPSGILVGPVIQVKE